MGMMYWWASARIVIDSPLTIGIEQRSVRTEDILSLPARGSSALLSAVNGFIQTVYGLRELGRDLARSSGARS